MYGFANMRVVFRGGLEENVIADSIDIPVHTLHTNKMRELLRYIEHNVVINGYKHLTNNGELEGGILCIVNDTDIDIVDGTDTEIQDTDTIHFISTMHGG